MSSQTPPATQAVLVTRKSSGTSKKVKAKKLDVPSLKARGPVLAHPSWRDIIKECIVVTKEVRWGVSRSAIKKFVEDKYQFKVDGANIYRLNRAITSGVEAGYFILPKGLSGKVKLAPKVTTGTKVTNGPNEVRNTATKPFKAGPSVGVKKATNTNKGGKERSTAPLKRGAVQRAVTGTARPKMKTTKVVPGKKTSKARTTKSSVKPKPRRKKTAA